MLASGTFIGRPPARFDIPLNVVEGCRVPNFDPIERTDWSLCWERRGHVAVLKWGESSHHGLISEEIRASPPTRANCMGYVQNVTFQQRGTGERKRAAEYSARNV